MIWKDKTIISFSLIFALLFGWAISHTSFFQRGANWVSDYIQHTWGDTADFSDILIIDIDETSMRALESQLGVWPYERDVYAVTLEYLQQAGAKKIVFDILFSEKRNGDDVFSEALQMSDNVYLASILLHEFRLLDEQVTRALEKHGWLVSDPPELQDKGIILPHPDLLAHAHTGVISIFPDEDGVVRKLPLLMNIDQHYLPGMMLSLFAHDHEPGIEFDWNAGKARHGEVAWPVTDHGEVTLKYPVNLADMPVIPFYQFLLSVYGEGNHVLDAFRDKTVFIGSTATILGDYAYIPGAGRVHGLGILALTYHSLKNGSLLKTGVWSANVLVTLIFLLLMGGLIWLRGIRPLPLLAAYTVAIAMAFAVDVLFYRYADTRVWLLTPVLIATLFSAFAIFAKTLSLQLERAHLLLEKRAAEEARDLKAKFLAHMTHELRTPLTAIMGYNNIMLQGNISVTQQQEYLGIVENNSAHLLNLINNILDQSQIDAGQIKLITRDHEVRKLLDEVVMLLQPIAHDKSVALKLEVAPEVPRVLHIDRNRFKQVVINLTGNALKFVTRGYVKVTTTWDNDTLRIAVRDTGPGIPEKDLDNIFQAFQQVDTVIASDVKGTGLGLTISTNLARLMGGRIDVESTEGEGSTFTLTIHAPAVDPGEQSAGSSPAADTGQDRRAGYILLAEDNRDSALLISLILENSGYDVRLAENGEDVLKLYDAEVPAIILMDMNMPVMSGPEATRKIIDKGYQGQIIAMTAATEADSLQVMYEAGCSDEIEKPVEPEKLIKLIKTHVGQTG